MDESEAKDKRIETRRKPVRQDAEIYFLSLVATLSISKDSTSARELYKKAHAELPRASRLGTGQYELFYTLRKEWAELEQSFAHVKKNYNGGPRTPEYTVFGFMLASLTDEALNGLVARACSGVQELQGVVV